MARRGIKLFFRDNGLSLAMFGLFAAFLVGLSIAGCITANEELSEHGRSAISYGEYIMSGEFAEAVFENWESEFLQMGALVVLTIFLFQKGSTDSRKLRGKEPFDTSSRYSIIRASSWKLRGKAVGRMLHSNSLGIALFAIFLISFALHAIGGTSAHNEEAAWHGEPMLSVWQYITTAQFWFESLQNWQSEFLAVGALLVLSIYLRQRGSPESKPVGAPNSETGEPT